MLKTVVFVNVESLLVVIADSVMSIFPFRNSLFVFILIMVEMSLIFAVQPIVYVPLEIEQRDETSMLNQNLLQNEVESGAQSTLFVVFDIIKMYESAGS